MKTFDVTLMHWEEARADAARIRYQVFVIEQRVPEEMEWDEWDACSVHALARTDTGEVTGTGRLLPTVSSGCAHLGRMAVLPEWRRKGAGSVLLRALLAEAHRRGTRKIVLHAQLSAADFYRCHGFSKYGMPFIEAGLPHVAMSLLLDEGALSS